MSGPKLIKCIASSDPYMIGRSISRESLLADGYKHTYLQDRCVHLYTRGSVYIELSHLTFEETMQLLEQGN